MRAAVLPARHALPEWAIFSLPTALYTTSLINFCWYSNLDRPLLARAWAAGAAGVSILAEVGQLVIPGSGTFSIVDLALVLGAIAISDPVYKEYRNQ